MGSKFKKKVLVPTAILCLTPALFICGGCSKKAPDGKRMEAVRLYSESAKLIRLYIDSISAARDSATLLDLDSRFSNRLTSLNFNFPSETDLDISEGENDTLSNLTIKYVAIRDSLLYSYAHKKAEPDSVANDSIKL